MPKKSEGEMQEKATLDAIKKMRKRPKQAASTAAPSMGTMDEGDMQEEATLESAKSARMGMKCGGKVHKMAKGGMCRGGGKATRGTKFSGVK